MIRIAPRLSNSLTKFIPKILIIVILISIINTTTIYYDFLPHPPRCSRTGLCLCIRPRPPLPFKNSCHERAVLKYWAPASSRNVRGSQTLFFSSFWNGARSKVLIALFCSLEHPPPSASVIDKGFSTVLSAAMRLLPLLNAVRRFWNHVGSSHVVLESSETFLDHFGSRHVVLEVSKEFFEPFWLQPCCCCDHLFLSQTAILAQNGSEDSCQRCAH